MNLNQKNFLPETAPFFRLLSPNLFDLFDGAPVAFGQSMNNFQHIRKLLQRRPVCRRLNVFLQLLKGFLPQFFFIFFL